MAENGIKKEEKAPNGVAANGRRARLLEAHVLGYGAGALRRRTMLCPPCIDKSEECEQTIKIKLQLRVHSNSSKDFRSLQARRRKERRMHHPLLPLLQDQERQWTLLKSPLRRRLQH